MPSLKPSTLRNAAVNAVSESLWGFQAGMIASSTVLTIVLRQFGAGKTMIGSIVAIETLGFVMPQIVGVWMFRKVTYRRMPLVVWNLVAIIPFIFGISACIHASPSLGQGLSRWLVLASYAGFTFTIGMIMSVWMDWLANLFDKTIRGTVMGISFGSSAVMGVAGTLLAGRMIRAHPGVQTFASLYLIAGIVACVSVVLFLLIREQGVVPVQRSDALTTSNIARAFKESLADRNFVRFLVGRILASAGFTVPPFVTLYYLSAQGGGLAADTVVSVSAAQTAGMALGNLAAGRIGDRLGHRSVLIAGTVLQAAALIVLLTTRGAFSCLAVYFLAGLCMSMAWLSHYNMLFETCPHNERIVHITAGNFVFSAATAALPLLGGLAASVFGIVALFAGSLAVTLAAFGWYVAFVKEPRSLAPAGERAAEET